ncbi:hypothetical protein SSX86_010864 [Deinandra increscens subsp. villosa]|uniref:Uncharacterized protein n=1 Tax=Deinandra increscens subsp. villosa TaxID=3103831 RepID=A0AAP0DCT9_9ASTR
MDNLIKGSIAEELFLLSVLRELLGGSHGVPKVHYKGKHGEYYVKYDLANVDRAALWHQLCASEDEVIHIREERKDEVCSMTKENDVLIQKLSDAGATNSRLKSKEPKPPCGHPSVGILVKFGISGQIKLVSIEGFTDYKGCRNGFGLGKYPNGAGGCAGHGAQRWYWIVLWKVE